MGGQSKTEIRMKSIEWASVGAFRLLHSFTGSRSSRTFDAPSCGHSVIDIQSPIFLAWQRKLNTATQILLKRLGLWDRREIRAGLLSYVDQRALEIGITVAGGADVILLDEPTALMNCNEADRAVSLIRQLTEGKTLLVVEHDMNVVFSLADNVSVLCTAGL